ncbi:MAG TPA: DNA polymerase III subunit gamma/tau, partial [Hyphomicrobium sp.]|nr:DNA polymerase III subunit gamma/tau [Hyphomicrobium sp.]
MARKSPDTTDAGNTGAPAKPYVVLARKYRPQSFDDLIGQEAMVRTLRNAFASGRIAQAYMLTGVRGVGKTTTARIIARALNYETDTVTVPTIDMPVLGKHCAEIMESRHPDVIEMDAASNTGVDNIRELIESARYKPIIARIKVFIIDEVHMLSKGAFNALLKTLEEPPEHVKFIFATTEIRKVPVTVLSRTQRFDLRRVDVPELSTHFANIVGKEGAAAEDDALALISRAAGGSVRDGLSLLDQAIAMGEAHVGAETVRAMLGLADRGRIFDLLEHVFRGDAKAALLSLDELHRDGAEPVQLIVDLAEAVHAAARVKAVGPEAGGAGMSAEERRRAAAIGDRLSTPLLSRAWQMLLQGGEETGKAANPRAAAEMVLIRLAYT